MKMMTQLYNQMMTRVNINYKDISTNIDKTIEKIDENIRLLADIKESGKVVTSSEDIMATMDWTEINSNFLEARNFKVFQYRGYQFTLGDIRKWVGCLDSIDSPAVQLEPLQTLSLQTKAIKNASELQLQGNNSTFLLLPTAREGNVYTGICHSVHNWPHAYSATAHPCWLLGHLLQCGWYAPFLNAFLFDFCKRIELSFPCYPSSQYDL